MGKDNTRGGWGTFNHPPYHAIIHADETAHQGHRLYLNRHRHAGADIERVYNGRLRNTDLYLCRCGHHRPGLPDIRPLLAGGQD